MLTPEVEAMEETVQEIEEVQLIEEAIEVASGGKSMRTHSEQDSYHPGSPSGSTSGSPINLSSHYVDLEEIFNDDEMHLTIEPLMALELVMNLKTNKCKPLP